MSATSPILTVPKADLSLCTLQAFTVAALTGVWTAVGSPINLLGYLDSVMAEGEQALIEAMSTESAFMNRVPGPTDASITIIENVKRVTASTFLAGSGPVFAPMVQNYTYCQILFGYNTGNSHFDTVSLYGAWRRYTGGLQGSGGQKSGITIDQVDVSYAGSGLVPFSIVRT